MNARIWPVAPPMVTGLATILLLVLGLGVWGTQARIVAAVMAAGRVEVAMKRQVVQHLVGGVVVEILVDDGDVVRAGDLLLRLDGQQTATDLAIISGQLDELSARIFRLQAERDDLPGIRLVGNLEQRSNSNPRLLELLAGQQRLFKARALSLRSETDQLFEQQQQIHLEISGQNTQLEAVSEQQEIAADELNSLVVLHEKGLALTSRLTKIRKELANLKGLRGILDAEIARNRGRLTEIDLRVTGLARARRETAISELRDLFYQQSQLQERRKSLLKTLAQLKVRAG
ncbi:MAG: hypothetical protein ACU0C9_06705 [Paracoccaceae bacterium]